MFLAAIVLGEKSCYAGEYTCNSNCYGYGQYCIYSYTSYSVEYYCCDTTVEDVATGIGTALLVVIIVIPSVIVIVCIIVAICCCVKSKKSRQQQSQVVVAT